MNLNRNATSKGPGRATRRGLSLLQITRMFPDDDTAEAWFAAQRWPDGAACPHCGSCNVQSGAAHRTMPYRCRERACRKRFSVKTGSVMENSKLGYQVWAIATYLLTTGIKGVSSMKLHRDLGITQKSAWHLAHRIRETWGDQAEAFGGPVEADETYMGGKRRNLSNAHRAALRACDVGPGTVGKTPVAGVKDRATGRVSAGVVPNTTGPTLRGFVRERTSPGALVYSDEARAYRGLPYHDTVRHSVHEWVNDQAHTNGLESFWALLKRGHHGVYHKMSPKHLDRYVGEFAGRYNDRQRDTADQMAAMARGIVGKRLTYAALIA